MWEINKKKNRISQIIFILNFSARLEQSRFLFFFIPAVQFLYIGVHPIESLHMDNFQPHNITKLTNNILRLS